MKDGFWVGVCVGFIFIVLASIFVVWGGNPKGLYWRTVENAQDISMLCGYIYQGDGKLVTLENRVSKLENAPVWYGR